MNFESFGQIQLCTHADKGQSYIYIYSCHVTLKTSFSFSFLQMLVPLTSVKFIFSYLHTIVYTYTGPMQPLRCHHWWILNEFGYNYGNLYWRFGTHLKCLWQLMHFGQNLAFYAPPNQYFISSRPFCLRWFWESAARCMKHYGIRIEGTKYKRFCPFINIL